MSTRYSTSAKNSMLDAVGARLNNGYLRLYDGTPPATANAAITTQNLLVTLRFSATAFGAAAGGILTANPISDGIATYSPSGTAAWARGFESDGSTVVTDFDVSTSGAELNLASTLIPYNSTVRVSALTITEP